MATVSAESPVVLDYAATPRQDQILRRLRGLVTILFCMVLCGAFGWLMQPVSYRAAGFVQVEARTQVGTLDEMVLVDHVGVVTGVVAGIKSHENLKATSQLLGGIVAPAQLRSNLDVHPVPNSRLAMVTFTDADPRVAAATVNAAMSSSVSPGVTIVAPAAVPTRPYHEKFAALAGLAVGLLLGVAIVALRWK
jgi:uncharacterized protein involved in exopolysaccharide biosynthesis